MIPPGLAFVSISPRAWERQAQRHAAEVLLRLAAGQARGRRRQDAVDAGAQPVLRLQAGLRLMRDEGPRAHLFARHGAWRSTRAKAWPTSTCACWPIPASPRRRSPRPTCPKASMRKACCVRSRSATAWCWPVARAPRGPDHPRWPHGLGGAGRSGGRAARVAGRAEQPLDAERNRDERSVTRACRWCWSRIRSPKTAWRILRPHARVEVVSGRSRRARARAAGGRRAARAQRDARDRRRCSSQRRGCASSAAPAPASTRSTSTRRPRAASSWSTRRAATPWPPPSTRWR